MLNGIDVSKWQGSINWKAVKDSGVDFAILKATQGTNIVDSFFERNYKAAKKNGIAVGCYHYLKASTVKEALVECDWLLKHIRDKSFEFPIFLDMEDSAQYHNRKTTNAEIITAFCKKLEKNKYWAALYSNTFWLTHKIDSKAINSFSVWRAHYFRDRHSSPLIPKIYASETMWQYSERGKVDGIRTDVDLNISYVDFPTIIEKKHLNLAKEDTSKIKVGDLVKIKDTVQSWVNEKHIPNFAKQRSYRVIKATVNKALLGDILSWVYIKDVYRVKR